MAGVLGKRGFPLECAAAQVCREAGARVSTNIPVREMDLATHHNLDGRRLEVVADGLTLWHGAQLAIDATLVSPLRRDGSRPGFVLQTMTERSWQRHAVGKKEPYPELSGEGGRARLVVLAAEVGGWWSEETAKFLAALANAKAHCFQFHSAEQGQSCLPSQVGCSACMFGGQSVHSFLIGPAPRGWLGWRRAFSA